MRWIVTTVLFAALISATRRIEFLEAQPASDPQVLYWEQHGQPKTGTAVGVLYTPDVLSVLASRMSADAVPPAIVDALQQRTPVVAMWEASGTVPPPQPPY